ncbi:MAG: NAD-dependent epimerase/dehydratase family protein [Lewinellaceae bacterium]|nr:NAD-dependent epimerase/dehydratase family protein [Saprospiraceae bacterium]MCB9340658.1 NAD-dependent epimerase/dehydratase family protein [Lewinellaceae bacterium]
MQTILGAGGAIGIELAKTLPKYTSQVRLVSRHPKKVNDSDHLFPCDLTDKAQVAKAIEGSEIAYLTVGLPYDLKIWQSTWPSLMQNVIAACKDHGTKLVFFDNIYMYDPASIPHVTEEAPVSPASKKGMIRAQIADMLMEEVKQGHLKALIARSADFYGPDNGGSSVLIEMVVKPLAKGQKANWLGTVDHKHTFTYTPDAGKATAMLGNNADAYGQVWHLPTTSETWTGRQWIEETARLLGVKPKYRTVSKFVVRLMGLFTPVMKEFVEMYYQYDRDYVFDSSKFMRRYDFLPTSNQEGLKKVVEEIKAAF